MCCHVLCPSVATELHFADMVNWAVLAAVAGDDAAALQAAKELGKRQAAQQEKIGHGINTAGFERTAPDGFVHRPRIVWNGRFEFWRVNDCRNTVVALACRPA